MRDRSKKLTVVNTGQKKEVLTPDLTEKQSSSRPAILSPIIGIGADYLLKSIWDSVFEIKTDGSGQKYIYGKLPVVTQYGVTMYADNDSLDIPSIYDGLPIDNSTLVWKEGVLMVNPDIELGGASTWDELEGKPSWIGASKPAYQYSEIQNPPDLSKYVSSDDLSKYVTLDGNETITGKKDFTTGGLFVNGKQIQYDATNGCWKLEGNLLVTGGITMYADDTTSGGSSAYSTLGSLLNVDDSIDASASVDRVLFQAAGSSEWVTKPLSEIGGGGSVSGDYLPLSGGTISGDLTIANGANLNMKASSTAQNDSGDIVFKNYNDEEIARIWKDQSQQEFFVRFGSSDVSKVLLHSGNYARYAFPLTGGTLTGKLNINTRGIGNLLTLTEQTGVVSYISYTAKGVTDTISAETGFAKDTKYGTNNLVGYLCCGGPRIAVNSSGGAYYQTEHGGTPYEILHSGNYSSYALPLSGGTLNGLLRIDFLNSIDNISSAVGLHVLRSAAQSDEWAAGVALTAYQGKGSVIMSGGNGGSIIYYNGNSYLDMASLRWDNEGNLFVPNIMFEKGGTVAEQYKCGMYMWNNILQITKRQLDLTFIKELLTIDLSNEIIKCQVITEFTDYIQTDGRYAYITSASFNSVVSSGGWAIGHILRKADKSFMGYSCGGFGQGGNLSYYFYGGDYDAHAMRLIGNNMLVTGGITMYSDIRKKQKLQDVELSLSQIANAPLIEHYYLSDQDKTTHVGSIAQYWAGLNDWFCKKDAEGYYTMEIQNAALASAISIARHLEKYESKTDKKIRQLKKRISQLEDELELLKKVA